MVPVAHDQRPLVATSVLCGNRRTRLGNRSLAATALVLSSVACGGDPRSSLEKRPIPEVQHHGFRQDVADEQRGNAVFYKAVFTREGNYLVTAGQGYRVWTGPAM